MALAKDRQKKLDTAVAELRKLEGKVLAGEVLCAVDLIPDEQVRRFLWACVGVAAQFMEQDQLRRKAEEGLS